MASLSRKKLNEIRSHHPDLHGSMNYGTAVALLERWNTDHVLKYIGPCLDFNVSFFFKQCRTKLTLGFVQLTEFKPFLRLENHKWIGNKWRLQEGDGVPVEWGGVREYNFEQLCELVYDAQKEKTRREDEMLQEKQALKLESAAFKLESALFDEAAFKLESALFEAESTLFEEKRALLAEKKALLAEKKALFMKRQALINAKGDFANESQINAEAKQAHFLAFYLG